MSVHLKSVDLGNTDTVHNKLSLTTYTCPGQSFVTRLDFQIYTLSGFMESPYPSGAIIFCSDGSPATSINVWPDEAIGPGGKVDMVRGTHVANGIRDITATHGRYVNSLAYADGNILAGRNEYGARWSQTDPASGVRGCVLKGMTLVYVAWFDGARLLFDCNTLHSDPNGNATTATTANLPSTPPTTTTFLLELTAGLLAVFSVILTIFVLLHVFRANSQRSAKVDVVTSPSAKARAGGYYHIVQPVGIPIAHTTHDLHAPFLPSGDPADIGGHAEDDDDDDLDLTLPVAITPTPTHSTRRYPFAGFGQGNRGAAQFGSMVGGRPPDLVFDDNESLYLPTSSSFFADTDMDLEDVDTLVKGDDV